MRVRDDPRERLRSQRAEDPYARCCLGYIEVGQSEHMRDTVLTHLLLLTKTTKDTTDL